MFSVMNNQYSAFKKLIVQNLQTIKELLDQVKELNTLVEGNQSDEFKQEIAKRQDAMYNTISSLLDSTNELFAQYMKSLDK